MSSIWNISARISDVSLAGEEGFQRFDQCEDDTLPARCVTSLLTRPVCEDLYRYTLATYRLAHHHVQPTRQLAQKNMTSTT